ncbi:hypothetical protein LU11_gp274 [Pseudomonas phage Lu11]|uniref:hypothetical protein n=1 Tax=Pseudomonas phage Lu11 TaxID=1161927 RepID=UPI00025F1839|nr:hypothetical protein LU11_gp274 [Pseudomonas phage Lu11]AFH14805.1 hypothetical protein Lu11_0268 [Pseudomonas phage Lu11]
MTTKCCCCKCDRHAKSDALTALFLAVFALLFFLGIVWYINGPKSNSFNGYSERHAERARDVQKREEWAQYWYTEFQLREPPRFSYETVNKMKARCKENGALFKRVDFEHKISRSPGAVCITGHGSKTQGVTIFFDQGFRKVLL